MRLLEVGQGVQKFVVATEFKEPPSVHALALFCFVMLREFLASRDIQGSLNSEITIYTDGSKIGGKVGSGFVVFKRKKVIFFQNARLPDKATVFQAELYAIFLACLLYTSPSPRD